MLLSNRQRKYMSLLLCLLMIFTIFSWNVQQVHAVAPAVPVAYVTGAILIGMGVVAVDLTSQSKIGQYVFDHSSISTQQKLIAMAGAIQVGKQYFIKLSSSLFDELTNIINPLIDGANFQINDDGMYEYADFTLGYHTFGTPVHTDVKVHKIYLNGSTVPFMEISCLSLLSYEIYNTSLFTRLTWITSSGSTMFQNFYFPEGTVSMVVDATPSVTSIPMNPEYMPKQTSPPPFPLFVDPGTLTLPQTQDSLYDGVPLAPESDVPYTPGETTGTIEGDVGIISGVVGTIGQILSNIWNKILEILSSMVAFFQAIMEWVNSFMSELALTIEAVLTEFFTVPTPFVLPTDMFDGMLDDLLDKTGLSAFDQTFSRLQNLQTGYGSPPEITINLHELMAATSYVGSGFSVPLANKESLVIDFSKLEQVEFWNMSLIDLIRALLSLSMVGMTFNYIYRKIIPDKVIE